ncbi:MAG: DUF1320 family protein [Thermoguttaceae bacterium]|nr:DUF1320 family protein [Thermoguttaceae bacterium]
MSEERIYVNRDMLELIFGKANINRWADLDGDDDAFKIQQRINFAIQTASSYIETVLRGRNYHNVIIDSSIRRLIAQIAALHLYDAREMIDGDSAADKMSMVRTQVDEYLGKIRRGEIILKGERTQAAPTVVPYEDSSNSKNSQRPFFCSQDDPFYGRFHP